MTWTTPVIGSSVTSGFGPRSTSIPGARQVRSVGDGVVLAVGYNAIRGRWVAVRHDDGTTTTYQHLASVVVAKGQRVTGGTWLGVMGATGTASGVHLHLEAFPAGRFLLSADAFASVDRAVKALPRGGGYRVLGDGKTARF